MGINNYNPNKKLFLSIKNTALDFIPVFFSFIILIVFYKYPNLSNLLENKENMIINITNFINISLIISTAILGFLITHKSIVITANKKDNQLYNAVSQNKFLADQFRKSLKTPINISLIIISYDIICIINHNVFKVCIIISIMTYLILSVIRFMYYFDKVFEY